MQLHQFQPNVGGVDAFAIKAKQLDDNFAMLQPKSNGTYGIDQHRDGYTLNIFPAFPLKAQEPLYLTYNGLRSPEGDTVAQNGLQWLPAPTSGAAISPGPDGSLFVTVSGEMQWSEAPPSGTPAWRQIERCDGKTMYVWGTEWED